MPALGACLSRYWEMKKLMAGPPAPADPKDAATHAAGAADGAGKQDSEEAAAATANGAIATTDDSPTPAILSCEPTHVRLLMKALRPYTLGMSLAGAGGGGFLVCVLRDPLLEEKAPSSSNNAADIGTLQALVARCVPGAYVTRVTVDQEGLAVVVVEG